MNLLEYKTKLSSPLNQINFNKYPKSINHKITCTKKECQSICDLNKNCTKIILKINKNNNDIDIKTPICNYKDNQKNIFEEPLFDKLPNGLQNQKINVTFQTLNTSSNFISYKVIFYILVIILIIMVILN